MTDRSSEERSRLERAQHFYRDKMKIGGRIDVALVDFAESEMARAALEDRQEAAHVISGKDADAFIDAMKLDTPPSPERLEYLNRCAKESIAAESRVPSEAANDRQEAAAHLGGVCPKCHWFICQCQVPGVPSEATPSKENAPPEWPTLPAPDPFDAGFQAGLELGKYQAAPAEVPTPPKPLLLCNLCGLRRDEHIDTDHRFLDARTAPAPEVQGTPAKECICPTETWTVDGSDMHDSMCEIDHDSPVGTPQKETPPMKDAAKVRVAQYEARIPCGNCGHVHLGRCSVCDPPGCEQIVPPTVPAPEGVQEKEPQTFEEWWQIKRDYAGNWTAAAKGIAGHAYTSGEAAGRRSAITEIKEWARCRRQPTDAASMDWDAAYADALDAVITWCAELQEKL